jgi:hypothetical protein
MITVCLYSAPPVLALKTIQSNDFYIYFPENTGPLATRIAALCRPMADFLEERKIPITLPVHILLDSKLDRPEAITQLFPHREIRLPMRAPGVFEDGYTLADPWQYYLFKGLCALAIYGERSGIPAGAYRIFGEFVSPNIILPDWAIDGISHLLYEHYTLDRVWDPITDAIRKAGPIPGLDRVSHHPEIWPGQFSYRIYGRPFIRWVYNRFGWEKILHFLQLHGKGILPIEIDLKANSAFGMSWNQLWALFQLEQSPDIFQSNGIPIVGYWDKPYFYWNETGVYPGIAIPGTRSRYGYMDNNNWLWLSRYVQGVSKIEIQRRAIQRTLITDHVWDPGPGAVAVTRQLYTPKLIVFEKRSRTTPPTNGIHDDVPISHEIDGPAGALQMSGPVMDDHGRIAVAVNTDGNWDIWLYDSGWHRVTDTPALEADPWWIDGKLVYTSNVSGKFQIHSTGMQQLTFAPRAACLPRGRMYLDLDTAGWRVSPLNVYQIPALPETFAKPPPPSPKDDAKENKYQDYSAWKSLWPNYIGPDYFFNIDDFQLGVSTDAADVSRTYAWNAGIRYDLEDGQMTWLLGYRADELSVRMTRYPLRYVPQRSTAVDERRLEFHVSWSSQRIKQLTVAANWRHTAPRADATDPEDHWWAGLNWKDSVGQAYTALNLDTFNDNSQSVYGELLYRYGEKINTVIRLQGGKTWGELDPGRNTFRLGGNSGEGQFTQRSSRLFALRGFDSNIVEAEQAVSANFDIMWPFAKLQSGYKTIPLFLHNMTIGTFIDAGFAADHITSDEIFISAGIEIITGMQVAWDKKSSFSIGVAWPLKKPSDIVQQGPTLLVLVGRPL